MIAQRVFDSLGKLFVLYHFCKCESNRNSLNVAENSWGSQDCCCKQLFPFFFWRCLYLLGKLSQGFSGIANLTDGHTCLFRQVTRIGRLDLFSLYRFFRLRWLLGSCLLLLSSCLLLLLLLLLLCRTSLLHHLNLLWGKVFHAIWSLKRNKVLLLLLLRDLRRRRGSLHLSLLAHGDLTHVNQAAENLCECVRPVSTVLSPAPKDTAQQFRRLHTQHLCQAREATRLLHLGKREHAFLMLAICLTLILNLLHLHFMIALTLPFSCLTNLTLKLFSAICRFPCSFTIETSLLSHSLLMLTCTLAIDFQLLHLHKEIFFSTLGSLFLLQATLSLFLLPIATFIFTTLFPREFFSFPTLAILGFATISLFTIEQKLSIEFLLISNTLILCLLTKTFTFSA